MKHNILKDPAFLTSNVLPLTLSPSSKAVFHGDGSLTTQLWNEKFQFESQPTSLYMVSTPHKFQLIPNCYIDQYRLCASKYLALYGCRTASVQKIFFLQMIFLKHSVFDLHIDDSNPNFQSVNKKRVHHETYKHFWQNHPPNFTKKSFSKKKFHLSIFVHLFYNLINAYTIDSLRN